MYAISNASRVYISFLLLLCATLLFAPKVNASIYTWDDAWNDFDRLKRDVDELYREQVKRPVNSTITPSRSAPTVSKNASGGLSTSTNQILKEMGRSTDFNATSNYSASSAKNALKSCVRSTACAGRALGAGAVIYEGIKAWKDVYDIFHDPVTGEVYKELPLSNQYPSDGQTEALVYPSSNTSSPSYEEVNPKSCGFLRSNPTGCDTPVKVAYIGFDQTVSVVRCDSSLSNGKGLIGFNGSKCQYDNSGDGYEVPPNPREPISSQELDEFIDQGYSPEPSDFPVLVSDSPAPLILKEPESITLSTPAPVELPATTKISTDSNGKTTTTITNTLLTYNVLNNDSLSPSIGKTVTETTTTYDEFSNVMSTTTNTTSEQGVQHDAPSSGSGASVDIEIPPFCTWASIVCDWIGWTKEGIEGEEPDLINLISEFEPDEQQYNSGIGSGSCPAPMSLNLGIINRTVDVSYQPFCDFLDMIRPLVIAGAWLLSAFMYVGVLRRG